LLRSSGGKRSREIFWLARVLGGLVLRLICMRERSTGVALRPQPRSRLQIYGNLHGRVRMISYWPLGYAECNRMPDGSMERAHRARVEAQRERREHRRAGRASETPDLPITAASGLSTYASVARCYRGGGKFTLRRERRQSGRNSSSYTIVLNDSQSKGRPVVSERLKKAGSSEGRKPRIEART
jgi:hypothetical protein